uniref:Uncharacterized protein n=1 Tax=Arundo donax TaxID=35708 RepID=A0A0A9D9U2_ARUDO
MPQLRPNSSDSGRTGSDGPAQHLIAASPSILWLLLPPESTRMWNCGSRTVWRGISMVLGRRTAS